MGKLLIPRRTLLKAAPFVLAAPAILKSRPALAAYTGPGDIVNFATGGGAWYGLRAYSATAAAAHLKCIQVDGAHDVPTTSAGDFDWTNYSTWVATPHPGIVSILYDQSGNGFHAPVGGTGPVVSNSILGSAGRAGIVMIFGVTSGFTTTATFTQSEPYGFSAYAQRNTDTGSQQDILSFGTVSEVLGFLNATNTVYIYAGGSVGSVTANDGSPHALQALFAVTASTSIIVVDSTVTGSLNPGSGGPSAQNLAIAWRTGAINSMGGYFGEGGMLMSDIGATNRGLLATNQLNYYAGVTGNCADGRCGSLMMLGTGQ